MTTFALIIFVHVGLMGKTDSNSITALPGFKDMQSCQAAGKQTVAMASGTVKVIQFVCVAQ